MGILDDAIRQHLELKRQHGAESSDLERLEKEAFGPATRPGDPEFSDAGATESGSAIDPAAASPSGSTSDWLASEEATTVSPETGAGPGADAAPVETPAEQARIEHAEFGDTADHPAPSPEQLGPESEAEAPPAQAAPSAEPAAPESVPPEAPERNIFDPDGIDLSDLDLDLDTGDEPPPSEPAPPAESATPPAPPAAPAPTEDRPSGADDEPRPASGQDKGEEEGGKTEDEDLLEETPDFLQDAPEGEDLWFEQGPPRDFDFDDD